MPLYEFECEKCGNKFEEIVFYNEEKKVKCPKCNSKKVKKVISNNFYVIFKGKGFYTTDYKNTN